MKNKVIILVALVLAVVLAILYFNRSMFNSLLSANNPQVESLTKVKVGYMPFTSNWVMFLALEKNMFKDEGLDVEAISFISGTDAANALAQGDIAVHAINTFTDLLNIEARTPNSFKVLIVQQVSNQASNEALIISSNSSIKTLKQLTGKKIGVTPGIFSEAMVKKAYEKEIDFTKGTQIVKLPPQTQLASLEQGQIDALLAFEPTITIGLEKNSVTILDDHPFKRVAEPFPVGGYTISIKFMQDNPEVTKKIARVLLSALEYGTNNPEDVTKAVAKFTNTSESVVSKLRPNSNIPVSSLSEDYFSNIADLYLSLGQVETKVDTSSFRYDE